MCERRYAVRLGVAADVRKQAALVLVLADRYKSQVLTGRRTVADLSRERLAIHPGNSDTITRAHNNGRT